MPWTWGRAITEAFGSKQALVRENPRQPRCADHQDGRRGDAHLHHAQRGQKAKTLIIGTAAAYVHVAQPEAGREDRQRLSLRRCSSPPMPRASSPSRRSASGIKPYAVTNLTPDVLVTYVRNTASATPDAPSSSASPI